MEDSSKSSTNKALSSKRTISSPEESGWTVYLQYSSSHDKESSSSPARESESSLVSDAASSVACGLPDNNRDFGHSSGLDLNKSCKELTRRARRTSDDDALEDTASSPANSPRVADVKPLDLSPRQRDGRTTNSLVKKGSRVVNVLNGRQGRDMN